ncbi:MAG: VOC family protein [Desulfoplanes sp.]|nr:VOC family protein [Desulfoplanes sp.]MDD4649074.1 VOC family protein [Desulfoplanes sp.]
MSIYTGINHLAMATRDMETTIRFWRDLLHMRMVAGLGHAGYRQYFFQISSEDMIAFFEWPKVEKIAEKDHGVPVQGPFAFDHISLQVSSTEELWTIKDRLEANDIWVSEVVDHGFIHSIYSFDPNNIPIEFSVPIPEINLRSEPQMHDKTPCPAALEGPEPQEGVWKEIPEPTPLKDRVVYPGEGIIFKGK